ncbi:NYN domain-containing protein [Patescibacteria group bacterium]|nr:NYN domain-containing protein [Patescibacteria group bacterium]MBU1123808.1 NYN domain-containing protein [Patescibacteria group bacterium]MBU1911701.1 NYN domain-containing protein [Patescibacteria group bacterium]
MNRTNKQITYAFVDSANIVYRNSDKSPWKIDLKKLIKYLSERFGASHVFFYGGLDKNNAVQVRLYNKMMTWGYIMRLNPVKHFVDERGERYTKADVDSRMTFEMMKLLTEYDRAVVMTGDGDFYWVLEHLMQCKKHVWLLASPNKTAKELKRLVGGDFSNLDNLRTQLEFNYQQ